MKPFLWLFLVFMLLFSLLGGCKMQTIQPPADSSFADKEKELEIYCLESANLSVYRLFGKHIRMCACQSRSLKHPGRWRMI